MRLKPTELRLIAGLLEEPAENAEELAGRILMALAEARLGVRHYIAVTREPDGTLYAWGPYPGRKSAQRDLGSGSLASQEGTRGTVLGLIRRGS